MNVSIDKIVEIKERQPVEDWFVLDDFHRITPEFYEKAEKGEVSNGSERCNRGILARGLQKYKAVPCQEAWEIALNIPFLEVLDSIGLLCDEADKQRAEEEKKRIEENYDHWLKTAVPSRYKDSEDLGMVSQALFNLGTGILLSTNREKREKYLWIFAKRWKKQGFSPLVVSSVDLLGLARTCGTYIYDYRYKEYLTCSHLILTDVSNEYQNSNFEIIKRLTKVRLDCSKGVILSSWQDIRRITETLGKDLTNDLTKETGSFVILEEN